MSPIKRIFINSAAVFANRLISPVTSFVLVLMIAKNLGPSYLGAYSSVLAMLFIFESIAALGFPHLITREVAQDRSSAGKYLINASIFGTVFSIGVALAMGFTGYLIYDTPEAVLSCYLLSAALLFYPAGLVSQSVFRGFERLHYITIPVVAGNLFKLGTGVIFLKLGYGIVFVIGAIAFSHIVVSVISFLLAVRHIKKSCVMSYRLDLSFVRLVIKASPIFALIFIVGAVRNNVDVLIINKVAGTLEAGYYSAASKLIIILKLGLSSFIIALQPVIFRLFKNSMEKFKITCVESLRLFYTWIVPVIIGTILLGDRIIALIYSSEFIPAVKVLYILVFILILFSQNQMFANMLIAAGHQRINFTANLIGMVVSIVLNIYLITKMGFVGAGIAAVSASLATCIYQYWYFRRYFFKLSFFSLLLKPAIAGAVMGAFVYYARHENLIMVIVAAALIYLVVLVVTNGINVKQFRTFKQAIEVHK